MELLFSAYLHIKSIIWLSFRFLENFNEDQCRKLGIDLENTCLRIQLQD